MALKLRKVVFPAVVLSALFPYAHAHEPFGPGAGVPSFAALEIAGVTPSIVSAHASGEALKLQNGPSNSALLAPLPSRDALGLSVSYAIRPWISADFAAGVVRAREADGNPINLGTNVFEQAGATLYPARNWNASLFVNYFRMGATTFDEGVSAASASFVNARVNHQLTRDMRLSFDVLNLFDKRVSGVDTLATPRLWTEPLVAENVLFDASESRGFRLRLRAEF